MAWKNLHPITRTGLALAPGLVIFSTAIMVPRWFGLEWASPGDSPRQILSNGFIPLFYDAFTGALLSPLLLLVGLFADRARQTLLTLAWPLVVYLICFGIHTFHVRFYNYWRTGKMNYTLPKELLYYAGVFGLALVIRLCIPTRSVALPPPTPPSA